MGARRISCFTDSLLVANQLNGSYEARESSMRKYIQKVKEESSPLENLKIEQIPRSRNKEADALSKMASLSFDHLIKQVLVETLEKRSIEGESTCAPAEQEDSWMTPLCAYLERGALPEDRKEARKIRVKAPGYAVREGTLFKRGYLMPWLRCLGPKEAAEVVLEYHAGECGSHSGPRATAQRILRAGYFWPTLAKDVEQVVISCESCQIHADIPRLPKVKLVSISSPWPFAQWGIDIVGPFPEAPGRVKFLVVAIDYFTKWVEAEPLAVISGQHMSRFVFKQIVCRYGIPRTIISDNGKQFADNPFKAWCAEHGIQQKFTSVAHPQANGQTEVTNRTLVKGIKKRLGRARHGWVDELPHVLWSYRTTPRTGTRETPFSLVYGSEAVMPSEMTLPTERTLSPDKEGENGLRVNLDLLEERRENAMAREAMYKALTEAHYNRKVKGKTCKPGDLVLRKNEASRIQPPGKLAPNWEGPYRILLAKGDGTYVLETLEGIRIPRTWNMTNLRRFHF